MKDRYVRLLPFSHEQTSITVLVFHTYTRIKNKVKTIFNDPKCAKIRGKSEEIKTYIILEILLPPLGQAGTTVCAFERAL